MKKTYNLYRYSVFYFTKNKSGPTELTICTNVICDCFKRSRKNIIAKFSTIRPHKKGWKLVRLISVNENYEEVNPDSIYAISNNWIKICGKTYSLTTKQFNLIKSYGIDRFWMTII